MVHVLFVCSNNAGRSQIAEAFFNHMAAERGVDAKAESGGTVAMGAVNPRIVRCMEEAGISMEEQKPKQVTAEMVQRASRIVSLDAAVQGGRSVAPFAPSDEWPTRDPAGEDTGTVRVIRDEIAGRVSQLLDEISA